MLWSQYKLATIRRTEFLHKEITGILNIANRNSNFLTLQTSEFQKKNPIGIFGIKHRIRIPLTMGVPEIGTKIRIPNLGSAAEARHLQHGVSSGSGVAALAERRRQRGSGM
jgi:hypothetical protein